METGGQLHSVTGQRPDGQSSSASSELKLLLRLLPLDAAGDPAERSGSVPKGERGSSIRISSSRCSSFKVLQKKSVKWERGSEKVLEPSVCSPAFPAIIAAGKGVRWVYSGLLMSS